MNTVRYHVVHETDYVYQGAVTLSQQYLHLTPREFAYQRVDAHDLQIRPGAHDSSEGIDYFGNHVRHVTITEAHDKLLVRAESSVTLAPRVGLDGILGSPAWDGLRESLRRPPNAAWLDACRYLHASPHVACSAALAGYAAPSFEPGRSQLEAALDLTHRIHADFEFDPKATDISTPLEHVLKVRRGVCQDFAHLMIGCLRSIGLPARYVSGYILTHPPPGQPRMIGADASHAWVSVFCPNLGWVDFDPTNRCLVQHEHITLGWGRDFSDVTLLRGIVLGGGRQELSVRVTVTPLAGG